MVGWSGHSSNIKMPSNIAASIEVYLKGETKPISPVRIATTLRKVAIKTAKAALIISDHDDASNELHSALVIIIPAKKALPIIVDRATVMVGTSLVILRVEISLIAKKIIPTKAQREYELKPSRPGRTTIRTPTNPIIVALQRRHPTDSPRKRAAAIVTTSGKA